MRQKLRDRTIVKLLLLGNEEKKNKISKKNFEDFLFLFFIKIQAKEFKQKLRNFQTFFLDRSFWFGFWTEFFLEIFFFRNESIVSHF